MKVVALQIACMILAGCSGRQSSHPSTSSPEFAQFQRTNRERTAPHPPELVQRGREVFLTRPCVMCHTVRGTRALGRVGPDLTHVASRRSLAAGTFPNTRGHMAGWILNPQNLKPGTKMPPSLLPVDDVHALLAYLETLK
jgi:cytochrome c oxidase subunit II